MPGEGGCALRHAPALAGARGPHSARRFARLVGLLNKRDTLASALPHGDQRKLEVAMMMALEPKIFMFDEPTAGMSVDEVPVVLDLIARLRPTRRRPSSWSSTRWTSCARSRTASLS